MVELAGPCCTGKTQERCQRVFFLSSCAMIQNRTCALVQMCLSIAASILLQGQPVHWVDMTDGFSATRLHEILQCRIKEKVCDQMMS